MAVFIVDKPLGVTSHDVVARARKLLKTKRVGHAGTLDPLATGVLVILTEDATKLSPFLTASDKTYLAWVSFGVRVRRHWTRKGRFQKEVTPRTSPVKRSRGCYRPF